jgi:hypothetical protein
VLSDVKVAASYAYGASDRPVLPQMLNTENKYSIAAMADHVGEGLDEDDEEDEEDDVEDEEEVDEPQLQSDQIEVEDRDESQLSDIPEEDSDQPEPSSPPSAFPSDLPDQSYNLERGLRRIRPIVVRPNERHPPAESMPAQRFRQPASQPQSRPFSEIIRQGFSRVKAQTADMSRDVSSRLTKTFHLIHESTRKMPLSSIGRAITLLLGAILALGVLSVTLCFFYTRIGCDTIPATGLGRSVHSGFQTLCGECQGSTAPIDFSSMSSGDISKISLTFDGINKKVHELERRLSYRIDTKYGSLDSELANLKQQQMALTSHLADHVDSQSGSLGGNVASPLIPKINFFAPSNGAVVNPLRSSPTKDKLDALLVRVVKQMAGTTRHQANPPSTALVAWHDVGDCWCAANAAAGDFVRLAINTKEMLYPSELVIEHLPASSNLARGSTPRLLELWADFAHFNDEEWRDMKLDKMQDGNVLGPTYARLGKMAYDARGSATHVQSVILDVNQNGLLQYARSFVLRVTSNYGGDNVCLYRVRLHGLPVAAPQTGMVDDWYEQQGYGTGE